MSNAAQHIQREMEQVRREMERDLEDVMESASEAVNWRTYLGRYPWPVLGAAALLGYLAVPRRLELKSPDADTLRELSERNQVVVRANPKPQARGGFAGALFQLVANAAVRSAVSYAGQQLAAASRESPAALRQDPSRKDPSPGVSSGPGAGKRSARG